MLCDRSPENRPPRQQDATTGVRWETFHLAGLFLALMGISGCDKPPPGPASLATAHGPATSSPPPRLIHLTDEHCADGGWRCTIPVQCGGQSERYVLDTGGEVCTLAADHTRLMQVTRKDIRDSDSNGERSATLGFMDEMLVDGVTFYHISVESLGPYNSLQHGRVIWDASCPTISQSLLSRYTTVIDGPGHSLQIGGSAPSGPMIPFHSFTAGSHHLIVHGQRAGRDILVFLDTGYEHSRIADRGPGTGSVIVLDGVTIDLKKHADTLLHFDSTAEMSISVGKVITEIQVTLGWDILRTLVETIDYQHWRLGISKTSP